jgi:MFS family permease
MPAAARKPSRSGLWRHRDFMLLWAGQSVSELGSDVTMLVLPLTAVIVLRASTLQVGLLSAATTLPFLLIALPAGVVVDRIAKRWLMIGCDAARTLIIGSVPVAAALGALTLAQLYVVALLAGVLTVFFDVAYQSYTPALIGREQLMDGNGKLQATQAFAQVAGPSLGGGLFGLLRAGALTADAASYAISTASLLAIRTREPRRAPGASAARLPRRQELLAGLAFIARHPVLRKIAACTATCNLFVEMYLALQVIFLVRVLHVRPGFAGLLLAAAGLGGVAAGIFSGPISRRIGSARVIWVSMLGFGAPGLLVPLAEPGWRVALLAIGLVSLSFTAITYNIATVSYRQSICPPELLGRLNAAMRWIVWGTLPLGGLLGGTLGTALGVRPTIWIGITGTYAAGLWVLFSPLRRMRDVPSAEPPDRFAGQEPPPAKRSPGKVTGKPPHPRRPPATEP